MPGAEKATTDTAAITANTNTALAFGVTSATAAEIIEHFQGYEFTDGEGRQLYAILNRKQPYLRITVRREPAAPAANPTTSRAPTAAAHATTR
ncbi:hypothetical protein EGK14_13795 [Erwinia sp. 198]|nr:hypothetical protein EGK14_13795 [Erwinia sp. 198]